MVGDSVCSEVYSVGCFFVQMLIVVGFIAIVWVVGQVSLSLMEEWVDGRVEKYLKEKRAK